MCVCVGGGGGGRGGGVEGGGGGGGGGEGQGNYSSKWCLEPGNESKKALPTPMISARLP